MSTQRKPPQSDSRYVYLQVGKRFSSRRLAEAIRIALQSAPLNGEQRLPLISLYAQLQLHLDAQRRK